MAKWPLVPDIGTNTLGEPTVEAVPWPREAVVEISGARLDELASGTPVRITGIARPLDGQAGLISPVEQRPCIGYRVVAEEPGWSKVLDRSGCAPFLLNSDGVDVAVRGPFSVRVSAPFKMDFGEDVQQRLAGAVERRAARKDPESMADSATRWLDRQEQSGWSRFSWFELFFLRATAPFFIRNILPLFVPPTDAGDENYRYFEAHVLSGMTIVVEGVASVEVDPSGDRATLRDAPIRRAVIASAGHPVLVSLPPEVAYRLEL